MYNDLFKTRWPNFKPQEVLSPDGLKLLEKGIFPLRFSALDKLQAFASVLKKPVLVNHGNATRRGFRSIKDEIELNKELGRPVEQYSMHCAGIAFDLTVIGLTPEQLFKEALFFGWVGVGIYDWGCHVDDRDGNPGNWDERSNRKALFIN